MNKTTFVIYTVGALLSISNAVTAKNDYNDSEVLRYAKTLNVHELDPQLQSSELNEWLRYGPAHLDQVLWKISRDCDLKEHPQGVSTDDWPLCVRFTFKRGTISGWALIRIGTRTLGISGTPRLEYFTIMTDRQLGTRPNRLSELPRILN